MQNICSDEVGIVLPASFVLRSRQRGIATILIMLLVGLSLTAAVLGAMHFTRTTQEELLTVHTQTEAQMRAWSGAEAVRQFLGALQSNQQLATLAAKVAADVTAASGVAAPGGTAINISGISGVSANFVAVDSATNPTTFTAAITGTAAPGTKGEASSTLQVVYEVSNVTTPVTVPKKGGVTFNKSVKLGGGITVEMEEGSGNFVISVLGDFSTDGNTIKGVDLVRSTGSIYITSGSSFGELAANCDVNLTGSVTAQVINARRNICLSGGASGGSAINANGSVMAESSYDKNGAITAIGNPTDVASCRAPGSAQDGSNAATCGVPSATYVVDLSSGSAGAKSVKAKGNVILGSGHIGDLRAEGNLNVNWGATVDSGAITGTVLTPSQWFDKSVIKVTESSTGLTVAIPEVPRTTLSSYVIDAYGYESIANYVFKIDANGYKKVTVNNVSGIANGEYYLGRYAINWNSSADPFRNNNSNDYLCRTLEAGSSAGDPVCLRSAYGTSSAPATQIGLGFNGPSLFGYDASTKTWSLNGKSLAQGIAWFEGNLSLGSGTYYNTFIATKNIVTSGSDAVYAPNFAGYDGTFNGKRYAPTGICVNKNFPSIYPMQFCDTVNKTYLPDAYNGIGNYVALAGSVKNGTYTGVDSYDGGNIESGASTEFFGSVKAGNEFKSGGSTTIHGYVTALAAGNNVNNSMGGSTTFKLKLSELPPTFTPGDAETTGDTTPPSSAPGVKIRWSRYL